MHPRALAKCELHVAFSVLVDYSVRWTIVQEHSSSCLARQKETSAHSRTRMDSTLRDAIIHAVQHLMLSVDAIFDAIHERESSKVVRLHGIPWYALLSWIAGEFVLSL